MIALEERWTCPGLTSTACMKLTSPSRLVNRPGLSLLKHGKLLQTHGMVSIAHLSTRMTVS